MVPERIWCRLNCPHSLLEDQQRIRLVYNVYGSCLFRQAPKDPLKHGLTAALEAKLIRQTDQDGLKWSLLKQVLKVRMRV